MHNSWLNETTKKTPFDLLIGVTPKTHQRNTPPSEQQIPDLLKRRESARDAVQKAQRVMAQKRGQKFTPFKEGDKVWLEGTNLKATHPTAKLAPKHYGPFPITNKISDIVYQLELPPQWKIHNMFHASLLTRYRKTDMHGENYPEPLPDIIEGEPEYEVEEILGSRRHLIVTLIPVC